MEQEQISDKNRWFKNAIIDYISNREGKNTNLQDIWGHFKIALTFKVLHEMVDDGEFEGKGTPSVETPFHIVVYKNRKDVNAVVHTHSPYALSVSATAKIIPVFLDEIFSHIGGELEISPYAVPGSDELADNMIKHLKDKSAVLLSNHGAVCVGKNLEEAFRVAEIVEMICKMFILASVVGEVKSLPKDGVEYQRKMYETKKNSN